MSETFNFEDVQNYHECLEQIENAETIEDLKPALKKCLHHVFTRHYSSSAIDEPRV